MRVGVIGPVGPDQFADNIADALRRMGHLVTQLGPVHVRYRGAVATRVAMLARQAARPIDEYAQRRIVRIAIRERCEVVVNIDGGLTPTAVTRLRRGGARVALWFPDCVLSLGRSLMLLAQYDALFFKEPHLVDRLRANLDLPVYYMPEACNPRWHRPFGSVGTDPYLVVAGNMYPSRVRLLIVSARRASRSGYTVQDSLDGSAIHRVASCTQGITSREKIRRESSDLRPVC